MINDLTDSVIMQYHYILISFREYHLLYMPAIKVNNLDIIATRIQTDER